jgi:hypothetical protein
MSMWREIADLPKTIAPRLSSVGPEAALRLLDLGLTGQGGFRGEMLKFLTCNNQVERQAAAQTRNEAALSSVDESKLRPAVRGPQ